MIVCDFSEDTYNLKTKCSASFPALQFRNADVEVTWKMFRCQKKGTGSCFWALANKLQL